jgi:hypothetical protein
VPNYEYMRYLIMHRDIAYCACYKCGCERIINVDQLLPPNPRHGQWKMHFFRLFHENFTTVGQLDGVLLEARIRYKSL